MSWDWLPIQTHDEDDEAGELAAEPVVAPGKRTRTQGLAAPDVTGGVHVPNTEHVVAVRRASGRWSYEAQLKVTMVDSALASVSARGTPAAGPDATVAGTLPAATVQRKATFQRVAHGGTELASRIAATVAKPSVRLEDAFPGLTFSVGGELGQASLTATGEGDLPAISLGSLNVTVTGDVTRWVLGDVLAKRSGVKVEILAQIKVQIDPQDLRHLARAIELAQRLARMAAESEKVADQIRRANVAIQKTRAALARATSRGPRGAALAAKLRRRLARMIVRREAKRRTAGALRTVLRRTGVELSKTLAKVHGTAARLASRAIAKTAARVIARALTALNIVMAVLDLIDIVRMFRAMAIGAATLHFGGGGSKAARRGDRVDGNSTTVGTPDALGVGPDDTTLHGDGGTTGDDPHAGSADGGPDGGDTTGDAASDAATDDAVAGATLDDDAGDDLADDEGGPGAGASTGAVASHDDVATGIPGASPDRADLPVDADRGTGRVAVPQDSSAVTSAGADPDAPVPLIVTNPNAARVLAALDGLGQPISPRVVEILDVLIPDDLAPEQVWALIERLVAATPGDRDADEDALIAALARTVADFLSEQDIVAADRQRPGNSTGGGRGQGKRRRRARRGPAARQGDRARRPLRVRGGDGLTPVFFDDGSLGLRQRQIEGWIEIHGDQVIRSPAATKWLEAWRGKLPLDGRRHGPTLREAAVSGTRVDGHRFDVAITFTFQGRGGKDSVHAVRVQYDPHAASGRRASRTRPTSMGPFARLMEPPRLYQPLTLRHGEPIDLGGFRAIVVDSNQPLHDLFQTTATFVVTIEIVEVTDPAVVEWMGHPVEPGERITRQVAIPLTAP